LKTANFYGRKHFPVHSGDQYQPPVDRSPYTVLSATDHYAIGKYAAEHGNTKASNEYKLPKSSVGKLKHLVYL